MKTFREYLLEEYSKTSLILYTRGSKEKIMDIANFQYKNISHSDLNSYEGAIYCFSDLNQALQHSSYGPYILKLTIPGGTKNIFYTNFNAYKKAVNNNAIEGEYADEANFIDAQLEKFGLDKEVLIKKNIYPVLRYNYPKGSNPENSKHKSFKGDQDFQAFTRYLERSGKVIPDKIKGIEKDLYNNTDVVIIFDNKAIVPLEILDSEGKTVEKFDKETKAEGYKNSRKNLSVEKINRSDLIPEFKYSSTGNVHLEGSGIDSLKKVKGIPKRVDKNFNCSWNLLTDLYGAPREVGGDFDCSRNKLATLNGAPRLINGNFICRKNNLTYLFGFPEEIGGIVDLTDNPKILESEIIKHSKALQGIRFVTDKGIYRSGNKLQ